MAELNVEIVSEERSIWSGAASAVSARTVNGEIGILPGHTPILGVLVEGDVVISTESGERTAAVDGGFLSVDHDTVTIVAETVTESAS